MPERPNGAVSKTVVSREGHRGFKSHSLRHLVRDPGFVDDRARQARRAYDGLASPYADTFFDELDRKPFDRALLDGFAGEVAPGPVLDVGSGPGHLARYLRGRGVETVALDVAPAMVATAQRMTPGLAAVEASMTSLPVRPGALSGIAAFYSIIHLDREELEPTFEEWRRALRPGGRVMVSFHGGEGVVEPPEMLGRPVDLSFTFYAPDEVSSALTAAGFDVESTDARDPYEFEAQTTRVYVTARSRLASRLHPRRKGQACDG